ncbi:MAG: hypothetical protein MUQ27_13135 [Acidimicrobiia bacterium]|nr:hypothetical protein [Acidimicrobiia bacterium]
MRRWVVIGVVGVLLLAGCSRGEEARQRIPDAIAEVENVGSLSVSGTVTIRDGWTYDPGDFPRTVHDGEECLPVDGQTDGGGVRGVLLVVEGDTGAIIGEASVESGAISGLGVRGFDLPDQLEAVLLAGDRLRRNADCLFTFAIELASGSSSYVFGADGLGELVVSHDDLESFEWVVDLAFD